MKKLNKIVLSLGFFVAIGAGVWYYTGIERGPIYEFNYERDAKPILEIFDKDWYWLVADSREHYSPELMLKYRAPKQNRMYEGRMQIKVLRNEQDQFVGFAAYYPKSKDVWFFNFLAIKPEFRGKRYADKLMACALADMKARGAQEIALITRPSNKAAQSVYRRFKFQETFNDGEYIGFTYFVK